MFYIGQEVVCIKTHSDKIVKEGEVFTIQGLKQFKCNCGIGIDVGFKEIRTAIFFNCCGSCNISYTPKINDGIWWISSELFKPLDELVSIDELTEVLEKPIFQ